MNSREGLGLKKSNTERATKIAAIKLTIIAAPLIKPQEKATQSVVIILPILRENKNNMHECL